MTEAGRELDGLRLLSLGAFLETHTRDDTWLLIYTIRWGRYTRLV